MRQTNGMNINYFRPTFRKFLTLLFGAIKKDVLNVADLRRIANALKFSDEENEKYKDILPIQVAPSIKPEPDLMVFENQPVDVCLVVEERAPVINQETIVQVHTPSTTPKSSEVYIELMSSDDEDDKNQNIATVPLNVSVLPPALNVSHDQSNIGRCNRTKSIKRKNHSVVNASYRENSSSGSNYSDNEEFCNTPILKKRKKRVSNISGEIVKSPGFKFTETQYRGKIIEKIFVPCKDDPSHGYKYAPLNRDKGYFYCYPCKKLHGVNVIIILYKNRVGGDYIRLSCVPHQCKSQKPMSPAAAAFENNGNETTMDSASENLRNSPGVGRSFSIGNDSENVENKEEIHENEIEMKPNLEAIRVSPPTDSFQQNLNNASNIQNVNANLSNQENHGNIEQRNSNIHRPESIHLSTATTSSKKRGRKSIGFSATPLTDYKLEYFTNPDGTKIQHLTIFEPNNKKLCKTYFYAKAPQAFLCCGCKMHEIHVRVKLIQSNEENSKDILAEYGTTQHVCEPSPEGQIIYPPLFEIRRNDIGEMKNLIIFSNKDRQLCYHFYFMVGNRFTCNCNRKVGAKIFENDQKEYYVKLGNVAHRCLPIPYSSSASPV